MDGNSRMKILIIALFCSAMSLNAANPRVLGVEVISAVSATGLVNSVFGPLNSNLIWRTRPTYFIDSVGGSDSNTGTNESFPFLTIAKLTNTVGTPVTNTIIKFSGGVLPWREQLNLASGNEVDRFGSGADPVFNAADIVTNWSKVGGFTSVYAVSNFTITGGGSDSLIQVIENGAQLVVTNSIANVDTLAGTFFVIGDSAIGSSTNLVYVNPRVSGNPFTNGSVYELSKRDHGIYGENNNRIAHVETRNPLNGGGAIKMLLNNLWQHVAAYNGGKHNFYLSSGRVEDSTFLWQQYYNPASSSASIGVYHSQTDGLAVEFYRCTFGGTAARFANASPLEGHTSTARAYDYAYLEDCIFQFCQSGDTAGTGTNGLYVNNRPLVEGVSLIGFASGGGTNIYLDPIFRLNPRVPFSASGYAFGNSGRNAYLWIGGARSSGTPYGISLSDTNTRLHVVDSFLSGVGQGIVISGRTNTVTTSNTVFTYGQPYVFGAGNTLIGANSNVFPAGATFDITGGGLITFGAYQSANPTLDTGSRTNDLQALGDLTQGDLRYAQTSPAVTNLAGPGWSLSRLPDWAVAQNIPRAFTPRLVGGLWLENQFRTSSNNLWVTKLNRTNDINYFARNSGNITNTSLTLVRYDALNNFDMSFNRAASGNENRLVFETAGSEVGYLGYLAAGTRLRLYGAGLDVIANNQSIDFYGGGGGADGMNFYVNSSLAQRMDSVGSLFLSSNLWATGAIAAVGQVSASSFLATGSSDNGFIALSNITAGKYWVITSSNVTQNITNIYATPWPAGLGWCYQIASTNAFKVLWTNGPCGTAGSAFPLSTDADANQKAVTNINYITLGSYVSSLTKLTSTDSAQLSIWDYTGTNYGTFRLNVLDGQASVGETLPSIVNFSNATFGGTLTAIRYIMTPFATTSNLDWVHDLFVVTNNIGTAATAFLFTNANTLGNGKILVFDSRTNAGWSFPATVQWAGGVAPQPWTNAVSVVSFNNYNGLTNGVWLYGIGQPPNSDLTLSTNGYQILASDIGRHIYLDIGCTNIILPSAASVPDGVFWLKEIGGTGSGTNCRIQLTSGDRIDRATNRMFSTDYAGIKVKSYGSTNWFVH